MVSSSEQAERHSVISPSSAKRWSKCPASALLCASVEEQPSEYAAEGRTAHRLAELWLLNEINPATGRPWAEGTDCRDHPQYNDFVAEVKQIDEQVRANSGDDAAKDMYKHVRTYTHFVHGQWSASEGSKLWVEYKAPLFYKLDDEGTADAVIFGGADRTLYVTDLKFGRGVPVSAIDNEQLAIYALSVLDVLSMTTDEIVERVVLTISQPRRDYCESWTLTVDQLEEWRKPLEDAAILALDPEAQTVAGPWCKSGFCKVKGRCRALKEYTAATVARAELGDPRLLSNAEIAEILPTLPTIKDWVSTLADYATEIAIKGETLPGYKLVATTGNRTIPNPEALIDAAVAKGYDRPFFYQRKPIALGAIEKIIAKEDRADIIEPHVYRPEGVALVEESDPRLAHGQAAAIEAFKDYGTEG